MHEPPHPGEVLKEFLGDALIAEAAVAMGVDQASLHRLVEGRSSVTREMAHSLGAALGTSPEMWAGLQRQHDLFVARGRSRP